MFKLFFVSFVSLFSISAFSMPCDSGYSCHSKSGKYKIELGRCRYTNSLRLLSVNIDHTEVTDSELKASFDGRSVGGSVLAFEVKLPSEEGTERLLAVEIKKKSGRGVLKEKYAEYLPGPARVLHTERAICRGEE